MADVEAIDSRPVPSNPPVTRVEILGGAAEQTSLQVRTGWFAEVERLAGR